MIDPRPKVFSLMEEFRAFALKGNVIDLAIAVIIGAAFSKIVDSLVKDIIMPLISAFFSAEGSYVNWVIVLNGVNIPIGRFLGEVVNFLIIALVMFVFFVKFLGWLMRLRKEEAAAAPPPLTKEQELLTEIRDLLRKNQT